MKNQITVEQGTEIRDRQGKTVARAGDVLDLSDDQKFGWPLYEINKATNAVISELQ